MNTTIEFYIFELVQVPNFTLNNFEFLDKTNFLDQVFPKREFPLNSQIRISLGAKFQLKLTPLIFFWPNLLKKNICSLKQKRSENQHWILPIRIRLSTNFSWNWVLIFFFDQICSNGEPNFNINLGVIHKCISSEIADFFHYFLNPLPLLLSGLLGKIFKSIILQHSIRKMLNTKSNLK